MHFILVFRNPGQRNAHLWPFYIRLYNIRKRQRHNDRFENNYYNKNNNNGDKNDNNNN